MVCHVGILLIVLNIVLMVVILFFCGFAHGLSLIGVFVSPFFSFVVFELCSVVGFSFAVGFWFVRTVWLCLFFYPLGCLLF
jgi:hypothetical protein